MGQFHDNQKDTINYKDSWLQNTVELAALGTILAGAGTMAAKGDFTGFTQGVGKNALKYGMRAGERYLQRTGRPGTKSIFSIGKKTTKNLNKYNIPEAKNIQQYAEDKILGMYKATTESVTNDVEAMRRINKRVADRLNQTKVTHRNMKEQDIIDMLTDQEIQNEVKRREGVTPQSNVKRTKEKKKNTSKKEMANQMFASGIAGFTLASGITGFHALERVISNKDNQSKVEDAFQYAGSFLTKKDDDKMNKKAGSLETYNTLTSIGKKLPEAVASGIGFTGVSLGTAKYLNAQKPKDDETKPKGTRVIIELGDEDPGNNQNLATPPASPYSLLPKFAEEGNEELMKKANARVRNFLSDLRGHGTEIERLNQINPSDIAAEQLRSADVSQLVKERYGNLVNNKTNNEFVGRLFDSQTAQADLAIKQQIKELERRKADARLKTGAGALALGGTGLGLASLGKPKENIHE